MFDKRNLDRAYEKGGISMGDGMIVSEQMRGKDVPFDRIRRITGYLVGSLDRFNTAKRSEVSDRVKHNVGEEVACVEKTA